MSSTMTGPDRRSLLKGAAWAAPAIVVAAAAPAAASSPTVPAVLTFTLVNPVPPATSTATRNGTNLSVSSTLANAGGTTTALRFTATLQPSTGGNFNNVTANALTGFDITNGASSGNGKQFIYTATSQLTSGSTRAFEPTFSNVGGGGTVNITASSTGSTNATTSATFA